MEYLHTMVRVENLEAALKFFSAGLGLSEFRRVDNEKGRFTLCLLYTSPSPRDLSTSRMPSSA